MAVISFVHRLSNLEIVCFFVGAMIFCVVFPPWVRSRVLRLPHNEKVANGALDAFKTVATFTILVLAFSLNQVQSSMRSVEELVAREASSINVVDRVLVRSANPRLIELRPFVLAYVKGIIEVEWPLLQNAQRSPKVDQLYRSFSTPARMMEGQTPHQQSTLVELVRSLDTVSDMRDMRIAAAGLALSPLFWYTALAMVMVLTLLACLMPATLERLVTIGGIASGIGILASLVIVIDGPFQGETSVRPTPLDQLVVIIESRQP